MSRFGESDRSTTPSHCLDEEQTLPAGSALVRQILDKGTLWLMMYLVTLSLFWWETGSLAKGLLFGLVAATVKSLVAVGHHRWVRGWLANADLR